MGVSKGLWWRWAAALGWLVAASAAPGACGGPQEAAGKGAECFRADDCAAGLVCINGVCDDDLSTIVSQVDGPTPVQDSGPMGAAGADSSAMDAAGAAGSGGAVGSAGAAGSGGRGGAAGSGGSGGRGGAAGTAGSAGASGTGGSAGTNGASGTAGTDGTGGDGGSTPDASPD
jgi:hypothetical protein